MPAPTATAIVSLDDAIKPYMVEVRRFRVPKTIAAAQHMLALFGAQFPGNSVQSITREDLLDHMAALQDRGLNPRTIFNQIARIGTPFLRDLHMSRATADRLANRHDLLVNPKPAIGPDEALSGPTEKDVTALVTKVLRLTRLLTTPDSVAQFLREPLRSRATYHLGRVARLHIARGRRGSSYGMGPFPLQPTAFDEL